MNMRRSHLTSGTALLAFAAGAFFLAHSRTAPADDRKSKTPVLTSAGGLKYVLQEPERKPAGSAPLVIMLHGTGGGSEYFRTWINGFRKKGWFVALPESSGCGTPASGNTSGDELKRWDAADIPNVLGLVREIMDGRDIDRRRVAILGFSNGAYYASRIGLGNPELFQSVICIAGGIGGRGWTDKSRTMGIYVIHGTADTSVPVQAGKSLAEDLKADGFKDVIYKEYPGRGHETFPEESDACLKWLEGQKRAFTPGANATLGWQEPEAGFAAMKADGKKGLLYLYSAQDTASDIAVNFEWGALADAKVAEIAKGLVCMKADKEAHADLVKAFGAKTPVILVVDADRKVLGRIEKACTPADVAALLKKLAGR